MVSVRNSTVQPGCQRAAFRTVSTSCPGAARAPRPGGLNTAHGAGASADAPSLSAGRAEQPHPQHHRGLVQPQHEEIRPWSRTRELRQHRRAPGPCSHPGQGASTAGETCPARRVLNWGCRSVPRHQGRTSSPSSSPAHPSSCGSSAHRREQRSGAASTDTAAALCPACTSARGAQRSGAGMEGEQEICEPSVKWGRTEKAGGGTGIPRERLWASSVSPEHLCFHAGSEPAPELTGSPAGFWEYRPEEETNTKSQIKSA